ncbi:beta strand repeat-containing protein [Chitinimonas sp.]|uniref:beta strand repeat-containing protein n=1 Tax=Chitinimonas sp. TaxID=1934313 RepID=UPI0035B2A75A
MQLPLSARPIGSLISWLALACVSLAAMATSITSVSATSGRYKAGSVITISVNFNGNITVSGSPTLTLNLAGSPSASCASNATPSTTITCSYTVLAGQNIATLDYATTTALGLNGGSIDDTTPAPATLTLPATGGGSSLAASAVVIDTTAPTLLGSNILTNNSVRPNTVRLTFSEEMNQAAVTNAANFSVSNSANNLTYSIAGATATAGGVSPTVVTLTLAAANPANTATYIANTDASGVKVTLNSAIADLAGNAISTASYYQATTAPTLDATVPTLPPANISINNSARPHTVTLTFSEPLLNNGPVSDITKYVLTNNSGAITYQVVSASQTAPGVVTLTLATPNPANTATFITSADVTSHLKVTLQNGMFDLAGNALASATITEAGATHTTDTTAPTLSTTLTIVDSTHVRLSFSEPMSKTLAETATNYALSGVTGFTGNPSAAVLASNGTDVTLTVAALTGLKTGDNLSVTVSPSLQDISGRAMAGSAVATVAVSIAPASFTFTPATKLPIKTITQSNAITISGLNAPASIAVTAGSDSTLLCAIAPASTGVFGSFASCAPTPALTINNGDQLKLQLTSAATASTTISGGVVIGGVSGIFSVTTSGPATVQGNITFSALTTLTGVVSSPDPALYVSANGVLVVPNNTALPVALTPTAPNNTAVLVADGSNIKVSTASSSVTVKPAAGSDALFVTKSYTIDGVPNTSLLELASGRATLSYSGPAAPVLSLQMGSGTAIKQVLVSAPLVGQATSASLTLDVQRNTDGSMTFAVISGAANLRLASAASAVVAADTASPLYKNEVASLNLLGKIASIRVGSLDGKAGVVGDNLGNITFPSNVKSRAKLPNLNAPLDRIDPALPLLQTLFDFIGSRTTLSQNSQGTFGSIPLLLNGTPLWIIPYGDVLVDPTRPDGIILADDGHFEVSRNGVYVKLTTSPSSLALFAQAVQSTYQGSVAITEDGSIEINNSGQTLLIKPDLVSSTTDGFTVGLSQNASGVLQFNTLGRSQLMYPHFYSLPQLISTFSFLDPKATTRDNLDGTVTAILLGKPYTLRPRYQILAPIGGIPPAHRSDPWWIGDDGLIYFKYPTGSAQGFSVQ